MQRRIHMKQSITYLLLLLLLPFLSFGQTRRSYEKTAIKNLKNKDYFAAMRNYQKAVQLDSAKLSNLVGTGEAARQFTAFAIAEKYYELAVAIDTTNETESLFWLGYSENSQGKYEEAAIHYGKWMEHRTDADSLYHFAEMYLKYNDWAKSNPIFDEEIKVTSLGDRINSASSDFGYARDGDKMYYTSMRFLNDKDRVKPKRYFNKLLVAVDGEEAGVKLDAPFNLNPDEHVGNLVFNEDASIGYFTICKPEDGKVACSIYLTEKQADGSFGEAQLLPETINAPGTNTTHPSVSTEKGQSVMYFSSDRAGGKGSMDIWRAEMTGKNSFNKPENIAAVNTPFEEVTPFYHPMSKTLFFSSNGHSGYGLFDVFKIKNQKGAWGDVENMKQPTNSSYNDTYYILSQDGRKAWIASNRPSSELIDEETGTCCNDIYELDIPVSVRLIVNVLNKLNRDLLNGVQVQLVDLTDGTIDTAELQQDGNRYFFPLELGKEYQLLGMRDGYIGDTVLVSTMHAKNSDIIEKDLLLEPQLELMAMTFDKITETPLPKAGVRLIDLGDMSKEQQVNDMSNKFAFALDFDKDYMLIAYREDFSTDTVLFSTKGMPFESQKITKKLFLEKDEGIYATLPIYFHNDEPSRTGALTSYETSYSRYLKLKPMYITEYSKGLASDEQQVAKKEVTRFFDYEVTKGYQSLNRFGVRLKKYMKRNRSVNIIIKGFASPLSDAQYNLALTKRRIDNVEKFLKEMDNGYLRPYFESGRIKVVIKPFGESKAAADVSDSTKNRQASVYNPKAARERRVEILQLKSAPNKTL